jgi:hypothetical protein
MKAMATAGWGLLVAMILAGCASGPSGPGMPLDTRASQPAAPTPVPASATAVTVTGNVARPVIPWQDGLTLMQAFAMAGYQDAANPSQLVIIRKRQFPVKVNYENLNQGQDMMLEPGDQIQVVP